MQNSLSMFTTKSNQKNIRKHCVVFHVSFFFFCSFFCVLLFCDGKKNQNIFGIIATSNNITNNQPVPSVCVRVPHSPSLEESGADSPTPGSPVEKTQHDFATLVVRESSTRSLNKILS